MAISNRERVGRGLDLLRDGLGPYVLRQCLARLPKNEADGVVGRLFPDGPPREAESEAELTTRIDVQQLFFVMWDFWNQVFHDQLGHSGRTLVSELRTVRNAWAHSQPFSIDDAHRALDTMARLADMVSAAQAEALREMATEVLRLKFEAETRREVKRSAEEVTAGAVQGLEPWRDVIQPHPDVAGGRYAQAEFAADLWQVLVGRAGPEYADPVEFLRRTFPTEGIRRLVTIALQRLSGRGGEPVVELQTSFGGGKTHSLLVLYHLMSGRVDAGSAATVEELLREAGVERPPVAHRAVLVGTRLNPAQPWTKPDGTEIRTLWGEMAWQLGGAEGYGIVAEADRKAVNPGERIVELFERFGPALVLVDEWVVFARQLVDRSDLSAGTFEANQSFAQALAEAAAAVPNALVVLSLPESDIEKGGPAGETALAALRHVMRRVEGVWRPASAEESFEIVRRRLFEPVPGDKEPARNATCRRFIQWYQRHRGDFPSECSELDYERRLQRAYPIHPELFDRLYGDWSTIERFQRTRGVLRLMAKIIYHLWSRGDMAPLILPGTVPLDASDVQSELTQYLPEGWGAVIDSDVDGPNSRPLRLDGEVPSFGRVQAARRVARTVFLGSSPGQAGEGSRGLEQVRVKLGSAMPGDTPAVFGDALARLGEESTYLFADGSRYWYDTRPNINRTARDRAAQLRTEDVEDALVALLRERRKRGIFQGVHAAPASSAEVPDEQRLRLVILGPGSPWQAGVDETAAGSAAAEILASRGAAPRSWQNVLVFLAPEKRPLDDLLAAVRQWLAWRSINADIDAERLNVDTYQRRQAESALEQAEATVRARLAETWCRLLVPSQQGTGAVEWEAVKLPAGEGSFEERAGRKLVAEGRVYTTMGPEVLHHILESYGLWRGRDHMGVRQLWEWCCQYLYMPRLASQDVLLACIQDAAKRIASSPFAYAAGYDEIHGRYLDLAFDGENPAVRADGSSLIVAIDVARRQLEQERPAPGPVPSPEPPPSGGGGGEPTPAAGATPPPPRALPRRFHGAVRLDTLRLGARAGQIGEEILAHLAQLPGAETEVSLEIQIRIPDGVPEDIQRIITENCRTLNFDDFGFEEE